MSDYSLRSEWKYILMLTAFHFVWVCCGKETCSLALFRLVCTQTITIIWIMGLRSEGGLHCRSAYTQRSADVVDVLVCFMGDVYSCILWWLCVCIQLHVVCRSPQWGSIGCCRSLRVSLHFLGYVHLTFIYACVKEHEWFVCVQKWYIKNCLSVYIARNVNF